MKMSYFMGIILLVLLNFIGTCHPSLRQDDDSIEKAISFDVFTCCSMVFGSCRSACENLSLVQLATVELNSKDFRLSEIKRFCIPIQIEFWACMNRTLQAVSRGSQWSGRVCCSLALSPRCQNVCATSSSKEELRYGCRQSDEQHLYSCFERQEFGDECCGNARTSECLQTCHDVFNQKSTPSKQHRKILEKVCNGNNSNAKVLQCVNKFIDLTPISNSKQYLPCCEYSQDDKCRQTCRNVLKSGETIHETIDELERGGCGPPLPHDPLWQCFLSSNRNIYIPTNSNEMSQINQIGMDSAKLHCCSRAVSPKCRKLCVQTFSNEWTTTSGDFDSDCLMQPLDLKLRQCVDEVDEPCELGCDGLSFCTNFNNRPTELFRNCAVLADNAAHSSVAMWQKLGSLNLPGLTLPVKNISKCSPDTWKAIACALQIKPCARTTHTNQICREDCYAILSNCMDWTQLDSSITAASICSKLSPDYEDTPCVSIKPYLQPSDIPLDTGGHHKLTSSCKGAPCSSTEVCVSNRNGTIGYQCMPGCALGEASAYRVPLGSYVRIPVSSADKGCLKICYCGISGRIEHCQPLPCFSLDGCRLAGKHFEHATWFYVECNICSCFAGEIICTKKQCRIAGISDESYTSLPCNCPPHYVPVCGNNGVTYHSACVAKCAALQDADIEFGACRSRPVCQPGSFTCSPNSKCVEDRQICLSVMHRPCLQYQCFNLSTSNCNSVEPACDTEGRTHQTTCHLLMFGAILLHLGSCFKGCSLKGTVCGINGVTYNNECEAWSDYSFVDYEGNCRQVGFLSSDMGPRCKNVKCAKLPSKHCKGIVPPGACCPICSGAFRIVFSRKQIDRSLYALKGKNVEILTMKNILRSLDELIRISECQLFGFLTMETDIFVAVQSRDRHPTAIQIAACTREAEKITSLITTQSHRITSNLALSALTVANKIPSDGDSSASQFLAANYICWILLLHIFFFIIHR